MLSGKAKHYGIAVTAAILAGFGGWICLQSLSEESASNHLPAAERSTTLEKSLIADPTDLYSSEPEWQFDPDDPSIATLSEQSISRKSIMVYLQHIGGDQLADSWYSAVQAHVSPQQYIEAKILAKKYDAPLRRLRRQRAGILEQTGVSIEDPENQLRQIRIQVRQLVSQATTEFTRTILSESQRSTVRREIEQRRSARLEREKKELNSAQTR